MRIMNVTKNTVLAENVIIADKPFKRIKGLLGRREFYKGEALIITPCNSMHTFFMRFPIDIIFVDSSNKIVKTISKMRPFRISNVCFKARFIIECPAGTIEATSTQIGDHIATT